MGGSNTWHSYESHCTVVQVWISNPDCISKLARNSNVMFLKPFAYNGEWVHYCLESSHHH